jgi:hypothetical protein
LIRSIDPLAAVALPTVNCLTFPQRGDPRPAPHNRGPTTNIADCNYCIMLLWSLVGLGMRRAVGAGLHGRKPHGTRPMDRANRTVANRRTTRLQMDRFLNIIVLQHNS